MNRLDSNARAVVMRCLVEGTSINSQYGEPEPVGPKPHNCAEKVT
jgi:hypothetical protein